MREHRRISLSSSSRGIASHSIVFAVGAIVCLGFIIATAPGVRKYKVYPSAYVVTQYERTLVNSSSLATILGQVRTSLADFIWVKSELYAHQGMAFKPHLHDESSGHETEVLDKEQLVHEEGHDHDHQEEDFYLLEEEYDEGQMDHEHDHDHEQDHESPLTEDGETTGSAQTKTEKNRKPRRRLTPEEKKERLESILVIPSEEKDFRGIIGAIQREVQPWGGHKFKTTEQVLPWYRVQTAINPQHPRAYVIAGWLLLNEKSEPNHLQKAEEFLKEGIENNPDYFQLPLMLGRVYIAQERWIEAIEEFRKARDLALKLRPEGGLESQVWSRSDEEDFAFTLRYPAFLSLRKLEDFDAAQAALEIGLSYRPFDEPMLSFKESLKRERVEGLREPGKQMKETRSTRRKKTNQ